MTRVRRLAGGGLALGLVAAGGNAAAQQLEPRAYANTPVGMNFLLTGYGFADGAVTTDPGSPIQGAHVTTDTAILGYARSFGLWDHSAKINFVAGQAWADGTASLAGQPGTRYVTGLIDPAVNASINLYGAPALTMNEFTNYQQDLIIGVRLGVTAPLGQYDASKLLNVGNNRWAFNPELGFSQAVGKFTLEVMPGATVYTDNDDYLGKVRRQDPIYSVQGHVIYSFPHHIWASLSGTYYNGGDTTVGGTDQRSLENDFRAGGTLALPLGRHESLKIYGSDGVYTRVGSNFMLIGIAFQYRWGGGL